MPDNASRVKLLDPRRIRVLEARLDSIDVEVEGKVYCGVRPKRPFPHSHPEILILYCGEEELGLLRDYRRLDAHSRELMEEVLSIMYFVPKIRKIYSIKMVKGRYEWKVLTDKGEVVFQTWSKCVRVLPNGRLTVRDVDGRVYYVERPDELDPRSRLLLSMLL